MVTMEEGEMTLVEVTSVETSKKEKQDDDGVNTVLIDSHFALPARSLDRSCTTYSCIYLPITFQSYHTRHRIDVRA